MQVVGPCPKVLISRANERRTVAVEGSRLSHDYPDPKLFDWQYCTNISCGRRAQEHDMNFRVF